MKTSMIVLTMVGFGLNAYAKTDVPAAMAQLKVNEENAKANRKQYDDNVEIASKNIVEVTAAIKQLRDQRAQLTSNAANLDKNLALLDKMKEKLSGFRSEELADQKKEDAQIAMLKATLEKLEANKVKRGQNVETYTQKITEVDTETSNWVGQKQAFTSIQKELDGKEAKAMGEREAWIAKRKGYRDEAAKWDKESSVAEQQRTKYEKLN